VAVDSKLLRPGDVRLAGRIDESLPGERAAPASAQVRRATLVLANLRFGDRTAAPDEGLRIPETAPVER
jgi:hypothetical protein